MSRLSIPERFEQFHAVNPHVYDRLVGLARQWANVRPGRQSIAMLFEVLRYETGLSTTGDPFKLNNDYRAEYSRLMMEREPEFRDKFEIRGGRDLFGHRIDPAQLSLDGLDDASQDVEEEEAA